jgi:hypothetical protein
MSGIRPGEPWERPTTAAADLVVTGGDAALAAAIDRHDDPLIRFEPGADSDLARTLGLRAGAAIRGYEVRLDCLDVDGRRAVAGVVLGTAPARTRRWSRRAAVDITVDGREHAVAATGIVALVAQHLGGDRIVPRGHPGDGRGEVQWYGVDPQQRAQLVARLPHGDHLDHPAVGSATFRELGLEVPPGWAVRLDGEVVAGPVHTVRVVPGAYRLLL